MSLLDDIRAAQVRAGEDAVIAHLKQTGLKMDIENPNPIPQITARIKGYRQLSAEEQALMNEGKDLAELVGIYIAKLRLHPQALANQAPHQPEGDALQPLDQRWISIGATQLQQGFMAVIRGIAQPTTF